MSELDRIIFNRQLSELIDLYESVIYGDDEFMGLLDCYDSYYSGCWDEKLKRIKALKEGIKREI